MSLSDYLQAVGLPQYIGVQAPQGEHPVSIERLFGDSQDVASALSDEAILNLYTYKVPKEDQDETTKEKFNIAEVYSIPLELGDLRSGHKDTTEWLWRLKTFVEALKRETGVHWLGVYRQLNYLEQDSLVKLAYVGEDSAPVFPVTPEIAENNNLVWVAASGKAKLISDRSAYKGAYYAISELEKGEICLPIIDGEGEVVGVLNAKSTEVGASALPNVVFPLARACVDLGVTGLLSKQ
eukprot:Phypoly_transcript_06694.p1 GENE.Phypoly_transcript_06694~~Phypoly_transcript_06694.p1  ORF type:complete len:238 (+),score=47.09 Phypoly_transcript_06694:1020-1733(+)